MFRVSTTPIIRITQNCNYNLRYCAATSLQRDRLATLEGGSIGKTLVNLGLSTFSEVFCQGATTPKPIAAL